jgi:predicted ATPase/DNA-binding CsgD family transcriptional regulator
MLSSTTRSTPPVDPPTPHNLPVRPDPLIGRDADLATAHALLLNGNAHLITLTGPGGVGKTRLALEIARAALPDFPDGVWFVDLSDITDPALVPNAIARALGLRDSRRSALESLEQAIAPHKVLLILDNFEHLLEASSTVARLIAVSPASRFIVTSREALRLRLEQRFPLEPLEYPSLDEGNGAERGSNKRVQLEDIGLYPAVQLFLARVQLVLPEFVLNEQNAEVVARVCARLDGLPLALELVAARVNMFGLHPILQRFGTGQSLPLIGASDAPARHGSLSAAIEWSFVLLKLPERALLRRLAVFESGWTVDAAGIVADTQDLGLDILDGLAALADRHLVRVTSSKEGVRFSMLKTIRDFALERLVECGELEWVTQRHAEYFLAFAETAETHLQDPNRDTWLDQLESEVENFWAVLRWAQSTLKLDLSLRLGSALSGLWFMRDYALEGSRWLTEAFKALDSSEIILETPVLAQGLRVAGELALTLGDFAESARLLERCLGLFRALNDGFLIAKVLNNLGNVAAFQGEPVRAGAFFQEALVWSRREGTVGLTAHILGDLGIHYAENGELDLAQGAYSEALEMMKVNDDQRGIARMAGRLGDLAIRRGKLMDAEKLLEENLPILRQLKLSFATADALAQLSVVALLQNAPERALRLVREALGICVQIGQQHGIKSNLEILAVVAVALKKPEVAARLFGVVAVLNKEIGMASDEFWNTIFEEYVSKARVALGPQFDTAWAHGQGWSLDQALEQAFAFGADTKPAAVFQPVVDTTPPEPESSTLLSPRELEVLKVVARGLSNKEVAKELKVSAHTVKFHLNAVFNKLECRTRAQAVRIAFDQGLIKPGDQYADLAGLGRTF